MKFINIKTETLVRKSQRIFQKIGTREEAKNHRIMGRTDIKKRKESLTFSSEQKQR